MSICEDTQNLFTNKIDFDLCYGSDGYLYAFHKLTQQAYVLVFGEWELVEEVMDMLQQLNSENFVDSLEEFSDDS